MIVHRGLEGPAAPAPAWVAVGVFDGVHLAHRRLLEALVRKARADGSRGLVVTFDPHPQTVLRPGEPPVPLLTPVDEKTERLADLGVDETAVLAFTPELAGVRPDAFLRDLAARRPLIGVVAGYNHAFGRGGAGTLALLGRLAAERGFGLHVEPPVRVHGQPVSSTRIRGLLAAGKAGPAAALLGRAYAVRGEVVRGRGLGRSFGFPTANCRVSPGDKLVPGDGVYAAFVRLEGRRFPAVVNVGENPTVGGTHRSVEAHLIGEDRDLYGKSIEIEFIETLRAEERFSSVQAMIGQMVRDRDLARETLNRQGGTHAPDQG